MGDVMVAATAMMVAAAMKMTETTKWWRTTSTKIMAAATANAMRRRLDEINAKEALTMALEDAPTEETNAGEWQGKARAD
jgi:hypothetical protein